MKIKGYKDISLSVDELIDLSGNVLKANNIRHYCIKANANPNAKSWLNEPDPNDGRKVLISYKSIPKQTIEKYNLPDVKKLIEQYKHDKAIDKACEIQQRIEFRHEKLENMLNIAANEEYTKYCPKYNKLITHKKENVKKAKVIELAKIHAVLQCCIDLKADYKIAELHEAYLNTNIKHSLKSVEKFRQKLLAGERNGINIIHKYAGKAREYLVKMSDWHIGTVEKYYSNPNKYTAKIIHALLTADCQREGKKEVSFDTVAKYISTPEVKNRLSVYRDKAYYRRVVAPSTRRLAPDFAGDLYYADGSPLQIPCWNADQTKQIRLNLFVVMDVKSKKIVGFDLAESEDKHNWLTAFKMAFSAQNILPAELMYDNASATKTSEFKALKDALAVKGCALNPTTKGEPKQKADVERWFNTFQSGYQRLIDGFLGEGIRTKRDNGRIDVEHLTHLQKINGAHTKGQITEIATHLIAMYNAGAGTKKPAPNAVFAESEKPNVQTATAVDIAFLFWTYRELKVSNSEVRITIRHTEYYYEIYEHATALKIDGTKVRVYYDAADPSTVQLFDLNGEPICECRQKIQFKKAKANQTPDDVRQIIKQSKHNEAKKTVAKQLSQAVAAKAMIGHEESFLQSTNPYEVYLKDALNDAETHALINQVENNNGVKFKNNYQPVTPVTPGTTVNKQKSLQEKHAKKNIVPATLAVIERP